MLSTWGGNGGTDTIMQEEFDRLGYETCAQYCDKYCWDYGVGWCANCALAEYEKETKKKSEVGE